MNHILHRDFFLRRFEMMLQENRNRQCYQPMNFYKERYGDYTPKRHLLLQYLINLQKMEIN